MIRLIQDFEIEFKIFKMNFKMNYLDKCVSKTDLYLNKLKPNCNLIIFVLNENVYIAYTINDFKKIFESKQKHYIEGVEKLETFFYLPNGIKVDSSLQTCFDNKANTLKLIKSENKFRLGFGENKRLYFYYSVEQVSRQYIGSYEESVFEDVKEDRFFVEKKVKEEKEDSDSEIEINWEEVHKQNEKRKQLEIRMKNKIEIREKKRLEKLKERDKKRGNYTETIEYKSDVKCKKIFKNFILIEEIWTESDMIHRDDDKPAIILYFENGNKRGESWVRYGRLARRHDSNPSIIGYFENNQIRLEDWRHLISRENGLPLDIHYHQNGHKSKEHWCGRKFLKCRIDGPCTIVYHENGCIKYEERHLDGKKHNHGDKPAMIMFFQNGKIEHEEWYENDKMYRDKENNLPTLIHYYESGAIQSEKWFQKEYKNSLQTIEYYENGMISYSVIKDSIKNTITRTSYSKTGMLHSMDFSRKTGPLFCNEGSIRLEYDEDGIKIKETHYNEFRSIKIILFSSKGNKTEEQCFQKDNKKITTFYDSGFKKDEKWFHNDVLNNIMDPSKPSLITYYENGNIERECWFVEGEKQRRQKENNLPAEISYYTNGEIKQKIWFRNGNEIEKRDYSSHAVCKSKITGC